MEVNVVYPVLEAEMAKRKVKRMQMALVIGVNYRTLYNKLNGYTPFTWNEVAAIRKAFFADMTSDQLFEMNKRSVT